MNQFWPIYCLNGDTQDRGKVVAAAAKTKEMEKKVANLPKKTIQLNLGYLIYATAAVVVVAAASDMLCHCFPHYRLNTHLAGLFSPSDQTASLPRSFPKRPSSRLQILAAAAAAAAPDTKRRRTLGSVVAGCTAKGINLLLIELATTTAATRTTELR